MTEELRETAELLLKAHGWIDSLIVAGVTERAAVTALMVAATERSLKAGGTDATAHWLEAQAAQVRQSGEEWLKVLAG